MISIKQATRSIFAAGIVTGAALMLTLILALLLTSCVRGGVGRDDAGADAGPEIDADCIAHFERDPFRLEGHCRELE